MSTALLVIDVQNALCFGEYAAFESERVIDRINGLSTAARRAGIPVIFIQHEEEGEMLRRGSEGWELARGMLVEESDLVIGKTATDSFHHTRLQAELARLGITRLVICGLQSEFCVDTTTRRALALGFPVTLVEDAHSTVDNAILSAAQIAAHHTATLANIDSFGPRVTPRTAADVAAAFTAPAIS